MTFLVDFFFQVDEDKGERLKYILDLFSFSQICSIDIHGLYKIISKSKVELWIWMTIYGKEWIIDIGIPHFC